MEFAKHLEDRKAQKLPEGMHVSVRTVETQIYKVLKTLRTVFFGHSKQNL